MKSTQKLNLFKLRIKEKTHNNKPFWRVYIAIDGVAIDMEHIIDLKVLVDSFRQTGSYYIFTHGSGWPALCGLHPVKVAVLKKKIRWQIDYPLETKVFHFDRREMLKRIHQCISRLKQVIESAGMDNQEYLEDYPVGPYGTDHARWSWCLAALKDMQQKAEKD